MVIRLTYLDMLGATVVLIELHCNSITLNYIIQTFQLIQFRITVIARVIGIQCNSITAQNSEEVR